jgi:hypothetical protein
MKLELRATFRNCNNGEILLKQVSHFMLYDQVNNQNNHCWVETINITSISWYNVSLSVNVLYVPDFLRNGRSRFDPRQGQTIFPLASVSRPAVGPTQPLVQWVPGVPSPGVKRGRGVTLTTHPIYCRGREWVGAIPPLPPSASMACSETALLYFTCQIKKWRI